MTDSISDNDTSEKPVREKLKKTSLASMSSHTVARQERAPKEQEKNSTSDHMYRDLSPEEETNKKGVEHRGRPEKKRSFDDLDTFEAVGNDAGREHVGIPTSNGHLRKRSRDVRVGEYPKEDRRPPLGGSPVREESEDAANGVEKSGACINGPMNAVDSESPAAETLSQVEMEHVKQPQDVNEPTQYVSGTVQQNDEPETEKGSADLEMRDLASSPRKKRSRDHFDTEADREQKIPATEEARAHRTSDELERGEGSFVRSRSPLSRNLSGGDEKEPVMVEKEKGLIDAHVGVEERVVGLIVHP